MQIKPVNALGDKGGLQLTAVGKHTHLANAQRIAHYFRENICYAVGLGWILWNGTCWQIDHTRAGALATGFVSGLSAKIAQEASDLLKVAAITETTEERKKRFAEAEARLKWAIQSENDHVISAGLKLARHSLMIQHSELNADPWLFNVQNGTVDLRTGKLLKHSSTDLITNIAPVHYDRDATCPTWDRFLAEAMNNDQEMVSFLQRGAGWSLTGIVEDRALFFLYGEQGKNGKSTFVETLMG